MRRALPLLLLLPAIAACGGGGEARPRGAVGGAGTGQTAPEDPAPVPSCGELPVERAPFGCTLAWGANGNRADRASYLDFITTWVGYETGGGLATDACDGCKLAQSLTNQKAMAVYYAYFIGYQASAAGYGDCNTDHDGQNLCTHGAEWLKANRQQVVDMYASYAKKTYAVSPDKPVAWLLEGDFVQYTYDDQSDPFSMEELGGLADEIVCAIKSNQPHALVAMDHSAWLADAVTNRFWAAMPTASLDFMWTTGVGDNAGFLNPSADVATYNAATARYRHLYEISGLGILVDTSFGASQAADSWSGVAASDLNERIAEGVIAVNVTLPPEDYRDRLEGRDSLAPTCE
jgi:hypothetical protein